MLKNAYFLEKDVKNRLSVRGSAPRPPRCYLQKHRPGIIE